MSLQASRSQQFALVSVSFRVGSTEIIALAKYRAVFLLDLLARNLGGFLAAIDLLHTLLSRDHLDVLLLASIGKNPINS